ncbi:MAG: YciK family oxidoreductase [Gammaproteobacteria bacterium]|nr:MAG: YciK family oxidoreductase [Pseudomonadota bacterium]PIE38454.1 MAG: YciK family oxidoreductase [Gammaproteobacteria bacterium]
MYNYDAPDHLLTDKIVLVTGAGDGIGKALAKCYAAKGATVILLGKTLRKLEEVYDEIEAAGHPRPAIAPLNLEVATDKDYEELANMIRNEFDRLDGIVHNAGILGTRTPIQHYSTEIWLKVMQINVNAPFQLTRALLPLLGKSASASIIFTSSSVGRKGRAYWGAYSVSKFAIEGLMQILADELDDKHSNIRVNSVNPGGTRTNMRASAYPAENPTNNPLPEEIMPVFLYLMGNDSEGVTGQAFNAQQVTHETNS